MSFGGGSGGSNPPWQRSSLGNTPVNPNAVPNLQQQMMNTGLVGFQNLAMSQQTQQNNMLMQPPGAANMAAMNNPTPMFGQAIQYQNPRGRMDGLNPHAFVSVPNAPQLMQHHHMQPGPSAPVQHGQMNQSVQMGSAFNWTAGPMGQQAQGSFTTCKEFRHISSVVNSVF